MATPNLTAARLRELLSYDPETGEFTRLVQTCGRALVGDIAGTAHVRGYRRIRVENVSHMAHRLAWLHVHGEWPTGLIDHIDGNPGNNRIANLRVVTSSLNQQNQRKAHSHNTKSGLLGVQANYKKWAANIRVSGKRTYLGSFDTPEEAHAAYLEAKRRLHATCTI